jgi:hypothetical protein
VDSWFHLADLLFSTQCGITVSKGDFFGIKLRHCTVFLASNYRRGESVGALRPRALGDNVQRRCGRKSRLPTATVAIDPELTFAWMIDQCSLIPL